MTTTSDHRVPAGRFEARCLELLDDVARTGRPIVVTKRGRPVAPVVPLEEGVPDLRGGIVAQGDLVSPVDDAWGTES